MGNREQFEREQLSQRDGEFPAGGNAHGPFFLNGHNQRTVASLITLILGCRSFGYRRESGAELCPGARARRARKMQNRRLCSLIF